MSKISEDLAEMKKKLGEYVNKGRVIGFHEVRKEPVIAVTPDKSKIKPLRKMKSCDVHFMAVDCSTRTLKRANNWGIYLFRTAYALVRRRDVHWDYEERIHTVVGDAYVRRKILQDVRLNLESEIALRLVRDAGESNYLLLDGASYFGGERKFWVELYEKCKEEGLKLLTISKQSPMLHDEKGRDLMAATCMLSPSYPLWVYYPVKPANIHEHQYGDVSMVKLSGESPRIFRCDIMEYLRNCEITELLSPLTFVSEDPRCLGYPVTLWLAHDFSTPSDSMLLHYHDQVEETLASAGLLNVLRVEELSCSFPDELHGVKHPFQREWIEHV
ncbi:MAG: DNA double-strand break repair nuclease NurA [Candidatus Bathyarchaeota archaeon]|nr:DNA double-strand break repair nuclease NurA [Candidatus Bathyarchaeota archaeon]MDH5418765.1 DNA double-strand break repair nuclease NurA [Candidatus Bathyarchaeota archaeon]MDH5623151.1 DNA double-strand break repair nuclease NurA [Candidatus Bathyarchaeota archaeon]MDH5701213.1 DNA double-strand break repair nuclease NurA [Candidatus Bathyarchaeota archaeon]